MDLTYRAFGLAIGSELPLPDLPTTDDKPEIWIRRGVIPEWNGDVTIRYGDRHRIHRQEWAVRFEALPFASLIQDGNLVKFEADPQQDEIATLFVLGSCTGALLFQRGLVPFHGNSIATPRGAVMVAGKIGAGKSATTFALLERGHRLLADDISAASFEVPETRVMPGFPRLKLWKNTLESFGRNCDTLRRLHHGVDKFHYPVDKSFCAEPQKLHAVYILRPSASSRVRVHALSGVAKLEALHEHLYKIRFNDAVRNWPSLLDKMCRLASDVKVIIVERPVKGDTIRAVASAIERDCLA